MERLGLNPELWKDRPVFVTGHTGFKGGWLVHCLLELGATVHGYSLPPPTIPSFYSATKLKKRLAIETIADVRESLVLTKAIEAAQPEIIFHLAAQSIVSESYRTPLETLDVNIMGTARLFEAVRRVGSVKAIVNVTSDKCYQNDGHDSAFSEQDRLGGRDPYSASKACAELITETYRRSFFEADGLKISTVRAGNVIGGGDWTVDRLLPDIVRARFKNRVALIRSPDSVRPWQHVVEPITGYIKLAEHLLDGDLRFAEAWNFGPSNGEVKSVRWILDRLRHLGYPADWKDLKVLNQREARTLSLDSSKANKLLNWYPRWDLDRALQETMLWYTGWRAGENMEKLTKAQIAAYASI